MRNKTLLLPLFAMGLSFAQQSEQKAIATVLDDWHKAAAEANFEVYFDKMASDGVFIGTDAKENWKIDAFKAFSKPYFDRGKAWAFSAVERNIYLDEDKEFAWFDELLDTWMGLCRGSGVMQKHTGEWKIAHYVLSIAVPNDDVAGLIALKKQKDSLLLIQLKSKYRSTGN